MGALAWTFKDIEGKMESLDKCGIKTSDAVLLDAVQSSNLPPNDKAKAGTDARHSPVRALNRTMHVGVFLRMLMEGVWKDLPAGKTMHDVMTVAYDAAFKGFHSRT